MLRRMLVVASDDWKRRGHTSLKDVAMCNSILACRTPTCDPDHMRADARPMAPMMAVTAKAYKCSGRVLGIIECLQLTCLAAFALQTSFLARNCMAHSQAPATLPCNATSLLDLPYAALQRYLATLPCNATNATLICRMLQRTRDRSSCVQSTVVVAYVDLPVPVTRCTKTNYVK